MLCAGVGLDDEGDAALVGLPGTLVAPEEEGEDWDAVSSASLEELV